MPSTSRLFNGAIFNFDTTPVTRIVGISYKNGGQWIDVTQPEDLNKLYELSTQPDFAVSLKFKGGCSMQRGHKAVASITWKDGTTTPCPGTWQVGPIETTGDYDAAVTGTAELRPTVADAA